MGEFAGNGEFDTQPEPESPGLHELRQTAQDELATVIEIRTALGEEPWRFLPELPTIDEQVILDLFRERCSLPDVASARARAYHPAARPGQSAQFEFELLRVIAIEHPALCTAVWRMLDRSPELSRLAG